MSNKMVLLGALLVILLLAACSGGADAVTQTATRYMLSDGMVDAIITDVVEGDPATHGADELYCVATDAARTDNGLPYLLVVTRTGSDWQAQPLIEGYYDWDLQGCPR